MNEHLANINFPELFRDKSLIEKVQLLHNVIDNAIHNFVPTHIVKHNVKCPWNNKLLQALKNKKNKAWKNFKRTGERDRFDSAFENFDQLNTTLYNIYVEKMKTSLKRNPSSFWQYVNSKKSTDNKPKVLQLGDDRTSNETEQADLFAKFFSDNYDAQQSTMTHHQHQLDDSTVHNDFQLSHAFVLEELLATNCKKGAGPDGIHPLLLRGCAHQLAMPLTIIFNESLSSGQFPNKWKRSSVTPIFKKGARSKIENYRLSKALDKVCHDKLSSKLGTFNLPINFISLLRSYLSGRSQFVKYGNSESADFNGTSGVPQGSHLGPTLFLLFINDIVYDMDDVFISLFADDVKIAKMIKTEHDANVLQQAIDKLKRWGKSITTTNYTYGDHVFDRVTEHKDLGTIIDSKLSFAKHIDAITSKATAALGFVK
ncbi:uncharacterized protein LOC116344703, partial [Contarinia nasturtii]|uniref:uncharacterized protein LOC116344703 n=1 Tax=Contarinia nasturtii TaxID=265458 RepID=UPI0012D47E0D